MFCPECKAEYRPGFARCSDCHVDLVDQLDARPTNAPRPPESNVAELLWTGTDQRIRGEIVRALDRAQIEYHERVSEVGMLPGFAQSVFGILIHGRDHDAARAALEKSAAAGTDLDDDDDDEGDNASPASSSEPSEDDADANAEADRDDDSGFDPEEFHPDDATAEVWTGADASAGESLVNCLAEVGIGCATTEAPGDFRIRVMPSSAARAQEIIQQIADADKE
ncbi:MAG TPA: hypothetical protein VGD60_13445 [Candidatus Acidoferrales bacterium]